MDNTCPPIRYFGPDFDKKIDAWEHLAKHNDLNLEYLIEWLREQRGMVAHVAANALEEAMRIAAGKETP